MRDHHRPSVNLSPFCKLSIGSISPVETLNRASSDAPLRRPRIGDERAYDSTPTSRSNRFESRMPSIFGRVTRGEKKEAQRLRVLQYSASRKVRLQLAEYLGRSQVSCRQACLEKSASKAELQRPTARFSGRIPWDGQGARCKVR